MVIKVNKILIESHTGMSFASVTSNALDYIDLLEKVPDVAHVLLWISMIMTDMPSVIPCSVKYEENQEIINDKQLVMHDQRSNETTEVILTSN